MEIAIITWDYTTQIYPIRVLSTLLSKKNHKVKIILAVSYLEKLEERENESYFIEKKMSGILEHVKECKIIGLSFFSVHYNMAKIASQMIREMYPDKIIISGGIHATVKPEEALGISDYVCVGEGEKSFISFIEAVGVNDEKIEIPGILSKDSSFGTHGSAIVFDKLDEIPIPGFHFSDTFIYLPNRNEWTIRDSSMFIPVNKEGEALFSYYLFPDRGCAHNCSYCCRPLMKELSGIKRIRKRSVVNVIKELEVAKEKLPGMQKVFVYSDDFLCWRLNELKDFIGLYKETIGFPFSFLLSPHSYKDEKMDVLLQSGLVIDCGVGIQTGSPRIRKIYNRHESNSRIIRMTRCLKKLSKKYRFLPSYDFIIDSPWEMDEDKLSTLKLICQIPKPFSIVLFSLSFYPGTKLHARALKEGLINGPLSSDNFLSNKSESMKYRISNKNSELFIRICRLCSVLPLPFVVVNMCYKSEIFLPLKFINIVTMFYHDKAHYGYLITIKKYNKIIISSIFRKISLVNTSE